MPAFCCAEEGYAALAAEPTSTPDGMLILPPGAMQPASPDMVLRAAEPSPVVVEQQLFANGLVVPAGYCCPTEGHCATPCIACRQAQFTGWSVAVDVLLAEPIWATGDLTLVNVEDDGNGAAGVRFTIGHESPSGSGIEARFGGIGFNDLSMVDIDQPNTVEPGEIRTFQFDFDLTQRIWIGDSSIVLGVGPRAAGLRYDFGPLPERRLVTGGLGLSATLHRPIWRSPKTQFAVVGFGRASIQGGELQDELDRFIADGTLSILEAGFGLEMRRECGYGDFVGRVMFEPQWWESNVMNPIYIDGLALRLGYQW